MYLYIFYVEYVHTIWDTYITPNPLFRRVNKKKKHKKAISNVVGQNISKQH